MCHMHTRAAPILVQVDSQQLPVTRSLLLVALTLSTIHDPSQPLYLSVTFHYLTHRQLHLVQSRSSNTSTRYTRTVRTSHPLYLHIHATPPTLEPRTSYEKIRTKNLTKCTSELNFNIHSFVIFLRVLLSFPLSTLGTQRPMHKTTNRLLHLQWIW